MGVGPGEASILSLWEYEALLFGWNESHGGAVDDFKTPDAATVQARLDLINADPRLTGAAVAA